MLYASDYSPTGLLTDDEIFETLKVGLEGKFSGKKILILLPDHTRSLPLPALFRMLVEILSDTKQLDCMVALGTHPALDTDHLNHLVGITAEERATTYAHVGLLNHTWNQPDTLKTIGLIDNAEFRKIAGDHWHDSLPETVSIRINKAIFDYDELIILGPTFPHEVVGFSGGAKYLFPGISGPDMINATHWLGALANVVGTIGIKDTPVRTMIHTATKHVDMPMTLIALTVIGHDLAGLFIGDIYEAWEKAVEASSERHILWTDKPYHRVLSHAPEMYDELWTAAKATYKIEPAMAMGGEIIIYAPHLDTISYVHGKYIYELGYHILPYILENWDAVKHIPLGVLAHSVHVRGSGHMENGIEKPNIKVTLASKISESDCKLLNLGYMDPDKINIDDWKGKEDQGIIYVPRAGEVLHKLRS